MQKFKTEVEILGMQQKKIANMYFTFILELEILQVRMMLSNF